MTARAIIFLFPFLVISNCIAQSNYDMQHTLFDSVMINTIKLKERMTEIKNAISQKSGSRVLESDMDSAITYPHPSVFLFRMGEACNKADDYIVTIDSDTTTITLKRCLDILKPQLYNFMAYYFAKPKIGKYYYVDALEKQIAQIENFEESIYQWFINRNLIVLKGAAATKVDVDKFYNELHFTDMETLQMVYDTKFVQRIFEKRMDLIEKDHEKYKTKQKWINVGLFVLSGTALTIAVVK